MSTIDDAVGLVPIDENFLKNATIYNIFLKSYKHEIDSITTGDGILGLDEKCLNAWVGESMPRFSSQRLYLQSHSQNVFKRWFLRLETEGQVWMVQKAAAKTMEQCSCVIQIYPRGFDGVGEYSVMFGGLRIEVRKAMLVLDGLLFRRGYQVDVDIPLVDLPEACIPQRRWWTRQSSRFASYGFLSVVTECNPPTSRERTYDTTKLRGYGLHDPVPGDLAQKSGELTATRKLEKNNPEDYNKAGKRRGELPGAGRAAANVEMARKTSRGERRMAKGIGVFPVTTDGNAAAMALQKDNTQN
ncbi:hypothetical protein N431DRAFT_449338 [Stipitochalara longipes BDJ]|nr:hypothetical protein N431DRAFT_449338 [Stipitochalara longipes BDJ]